MLEQAPAEYYIDESGNTGDLSTVKIDSYFVEQRIDRKSTRLNSSHIQKSRMPSSA